MAVDLRKNVLAPEEVRNHLILNASRLNTAHLLKLEIDSYTMALEGSLGAA